MLDLKPLSICNVDAVVVLYRKMIEESRMHYIRLGHVETDDRSIRNLLQYSFDIENDVFYVAYSHNEPIGFIDSTRATLDDGRDEWFIKSVYLLPEFRDSPYFETMVQRVEKDARLKGAARIFSNGMIDNAEINALWEGLGYETGANRRYKDL